MNNLRYGIVKVESFGCENTVTQYMCKYCDFVTDLRITLHDHTWSYHVSRDYYKSDSKIEAYTCNNCVFTSYSLLVRFAHEETHFKLRNKSKYLGNLKRRLNSYKYNCSQCSFQTRYKRSLNAHIANRHTDPIDIKWLKCEQCEYKARNRWYLRCHINRRHKPENLLQCKHCSYRSALKTDLEKHIIRRHTDPNEVEWFKCEQCEYKAQCKETLKNHIKMKHHPKNIMQCSHCPYRSAHKHHLKRHLITHHTGPAEIEWFKCAQCEYKTQYKETLKNHIKMKHRPENIMQCSHCPYRSAHKHHLKRHILTHHTASEEIKWFVCGQCDYRAKLKYRLNQHIKKVHINRNHV